MRALIILACLVLCATPALWASPTDTLPEPAHLPDRMPHFYSADCPTYQEGVPTLEQHDVKTCSEEAMLTYIYSNLVDPRLAQDSTQRKSKRRKRQALRTAVSFVVEKDGSITEVRTLSSTGDPALDHAAREVIAGMPDWVPGVTGGEMVKVAFTLPIRFGWE